MPRDKYYESGDMPEPSVGRKPTEKVRRGGAGSRPTPKLGSGMANRAAMAMRRRKRMLDQY